ncbi:MAG: hypothetical protein ACOH2N_09255 [Devosia sp.]
MTTTEIYLPEQAWTSLCDLIAARPDLCEVLGIHASPITGIPGFDEIVDRLGGEWNIWPERFRAAFAATQASF